MRRGVGACRVSPTFDYKWCTCHCIFYCGLPENFGPENTRKCLVFDPTQPKNKHTVGVSQGLTTKFFAGALQGALGRLGAAWAAPGRLRRSLNPCRTCPARFRENDLPGQKKGVEFFRVQPVGWAGWWGRARLWGM